MRIAYVCADRGIPVLGHKGASVHVRAITTALARQGHDVVLACATTGSGNDAPPVSRMIELPDDAAEQEHCLLDIFAGVDIVLERYALETGVARRAATRLGLGLVLEVNAPIVLEASRYRGLADLGPALERERLAFRTADAIATVTGHLAEYARAVAPGTPVSHIANGVDVDRFRSVAPADLGLAPGSVVVGFVGSMKPWHGVHELVTAFSAAMPRHPHAHLVLAGTGPEDRALRRRVAEEAGLAGRVHLLGAIAHDRVPATIAAFDVAVAPYQPSDDFYFSPLKVLEYLAAGRPIVYPALGELAEMVGGAGLAYDAGSVPALGAAIDSLLVDAGLRRRLSTAASAAARTRSWADVAERVEALLVAARVAASGAGAPALSGTGGSRP